LDSLLRDDHIYGVMINGFQEIYFERKGKTQRSTASYWSHAHLMHVVDRLCTKNNAVPPSEKNSVVRFSLPENSQVTILLPPVTSNPIALTFSRSTKNPITIDQLIQFGSISAEIMQFLKLSVEAGLNIMVCGHISSGADTLVSVLSSFIPGDERVISMGYESSRSLRINHLINLVASDEPTGENSFQKLLALAGDIGGDRLILYRFLSPEAYDALNRVNDNFRGSIIRMVAKSPGDAVNRLETLIQLDKPGLPVAKIKGLISSSIDLIVQQDRLRDGTRAVTNIVEVSDEIDNNDQVVLKELYDIEKVDVKNGRIIRRFRSYGPPSEKLIEKIGAAGIELPSSIFAADAGLEKTGELKEIDKRKIKFSKGNYAFISYSNKDLDSVIALANELERKGFYIWLDKWYLEPGQDWTRNLEKAIKNAGAFIVILTPNSVDAQAVRNEIVTAQDEGLPIIPVRMKECDVPIQIRALQYIPYDKHHKVATLNHISESLSKFISNKQLFSEI